MVYNTLQDADWGIYQTYVKHASFFIWLICFHLCLLNYFFTFSASSKQKTILSYWRNFTEMWNFPFSLSNSIHCHLHKNAWMVCELLYRHVLVWKGRGAICVVYVSVCHLLLHVCLHICLLTCNWTNRCDLLMWLNLSHRSCLRRLTFTVHVCHTCIVNM